MPMRSADNVVLRDLRVAVRDARAGGVTDAYQRAQFRVMSKRAYDGSYVTMDWDRITDTRVLDFAQKVLDRLANLERWFS